MTPEADLTPQGQPRRKPALYQRMTTEIGSFISSPEEFRSLSPHGKKVIKALLDHIDDLKAATRVDVKTNMPNDDACREELQGMIDRRPLPQTSGEQRSNPQYPLATVVLLDMDGLKKINDRYSHVAGDLAIKHIAHVLKTSGILRSTDYVARGGVRSDEFTIIMRNIEPIKAKLIIERLVHEIAKTPMQYTDSLGATFEIPVSASYGMTRMEYGDTIDALRERVSNDLKAAKDRLYGRTARARSQQDTAATNHTDRIPDSDYFGTTYSDSGDPTLPHTDKEDTTREQGTQHRDRAPQKRGKPEKRNPLMGGNDTGPVLP